MNSEINKENLAIEMKSITKRFGDFTANDNISLSVHKGEIHSLLGENGAGKSTLMNILYGLYSPTSGEIFINGEKVEINNPNDAIELGIGMVHQHFMLIDTFTVVENIMLGMETTKGIVLDHKEARKKVQDLSKRFGLYVDPDAKIRDVSVGMQQRVEILKTLYRGADILILDEPTAVLTPQEIEDLTLILKNLASQGKTIIIITHKLREIKEIADYCTVIRRGKMVGTVKVDQVLEEDLAEKMVGRQVIFRVDKEEKEPGDKVLDISNLVVKDIRGIKKVNGLDLQVMQGEIFGIAGVDENGQSELVDALTGLKKVESGTISLKGKEISNLRPREIIDSGINTIPQDRQRHGLVLEFDVGENMIIENFHKKPFSNKGILDYEIIYKNADELMEKFDVRPRNSKYTAGDLSGGNQQKLILAREINNNPDLLIAVQPTRGLDVGAIEFIRKYLIDQRDKGKAVLLISFELDEIMALSDRIGVIFDGKITDVLEAKDANEKRLGYLMAGGGVSDGS